MYLKLVPKLGFYSTNKVIVQIEDKKQAKKMSKVSLNNKVRLELENTLTLCNSRYTEYLKINYLKKMSLSVVDLSSANRSKWIIPICLSVISNIFITSTP